MHRANGVRSRTAPLVIEKLERHQLGAPSHSSNAEGVVANRSDSPRAVGAMVMVIRGVIVVSDEVPAIDIIDKSIPVIVETVVLASRSGFARVQPDVGRKIRMLKVNAGVNDAHHNAGRVGRCIPSRGCTHIEHPPELIEVRIIRGGGG